jgi:four helix bundle protein
MDKAELQRRTKQFALRVLKLVGVLPKGQPGWTIAGELTASATSVASNYLAACRSRSRAEFIAKIGVVEEEADESGFWMEIIMEGELLPRAAVMPLWREAHELTSIMAASRKTAKQNQATALPNRQSAIGGHHVLVVGQRQ